MFLGLAVFLILSIVLFVMLVRTIKWLFSTLTGGKKQAREQPKEASKEERKGEEKSAAMKESETVSESAEEAERAAKEQDPPSEELRQKYTSSLSRGISEAFWTEDSPLEINEKTIADKCTQNSGLTYLEFNNRSLAGEDFFGFNLLIEEDSRMVLTYNGQAVASITRVETATSFLINGRTVEGTRLSYRINTFPPALKPGMVPDDLAKMLGAADSVRACGGDPVLVADTMLVEFTGSENVSKLKTAIDGKIQSKESTMRRQQEKKQEKAPRRINAKVI